MAGENRPDVSFIFILSETMNECYFTSQLANMTVLVDLCRHLVNKWNVSCKCPTIYKYKKKKRGLRILKHQQTTAYCFEKNNNNAKLTCETIKACFKSAIIFWGPETLFSTCLKKSFFLKEKVYARKKRFTLVKKGLENLIPWHFWDRLYWFDKYVLHL